jgi:hypothetical protein
VTVNYLRSRALDRHREREVLVADLLGEEDVEALSYLPQEFEWSGQDLIAHSLVRYRDKFEELFKLVESWAPGALWEPRTLAGCDDEGGEKPASQAIRSARPQRVHETVALIELEGLMARLMEAPEGTVGLLISRSYYGQKGKRLLRQVLLLTNPDPLRYDRNLRWERTLEWNRR